MTDSITGAASAAGAGTSAGEPGAPAGVPCVNDPANRRVPGG